MSGDRSDFDDYVVALDRVMTERSREHLLGLESQVLANEALGVLDDLKHSAMTELVVAKAEIARLKESNANLVASEVELIEACRALIRAIEDGVASCDTELDAAEIAISNALGAK